jgi:hypothetical protein
LLGSQANDVRNGELEPIVGGFPKVNLMTHDQQSAPSFSAFILPLFLWLQQMGKPITNNVPL